MPAVANKMNGNRTNTNLIRHESSLFSSSLSEIFSRKHKILSSFHLGSQGMLDFLVVLHHTLWKLLLTTFSHNIFSHADGNNGVVYSPESMHDSKDPCCSQFCILMSPNVISFLLKERERNVIL
ncbi:hypothetical protein SLEP1_g57041 [Rubroshorea leprosula]|uniref:Uncharacterized protein n=1 Tax=Rubroshorea leprosula TaxID=152421 RepID=A0AAV5MK12_9ROSI|nr:hypothetical protein SLEP1_g57041 [Rubroshorea leprosula]